LKTRVLSPALEEISQAAVWFDRQRSGLGNEFWLAVDSMFSRIEENPQVFSKSEFAAPDVDLRFAVVRRFNYVVHFLIELNEVQIVSVAHGSRRPGHWLRRIKG
jgi:toxin ParE1/3/4